MRVAPNISHGGTDPESLYPLAARYRHAAKRPLMVKLSPNVTSIGYMTKVAEDVFSIRGRFART